MLRGLSRSLIGSIALLSLLVSLFFIFQKAPTESTGDVSFSISSTGFWDVYFSNPEDPVSRTLRGGPDAQLVEAMDAAQFSIDIAMYHLNLWSVRDALIYAHRRGVEVRMVTDSAYSEELEIVSLQDAGIPVIEDRRPSLMHHKFVVIDRNEVWTGSMNMTVNGAYRNDNNLFRIHSKEVSEDFVREFEEMFNEDRFGASSIPDTPYPSIHIDGSEVEVYFSPDDGVLDRLLELLREAEKKVEFLAYALTADAIGETLLELHQEGLSIRGVVEASQASATGSETPRLRQAGLHIRLDGNVESMHHKVFVIDNEIVLLGSYNFTRSAEEKNDENILIIHDPALASQFLIEFERIYQSATP